MQLPLVIFLGLTFTSSKGNYIGFVSATVGWPSGVMESCVLMERVMYGLVDGDGDGD